MEGDATDVGKLHKVATLSGGWRVSESVVIVERSIQENHGWLLYGMVCSSMRGKGLL